MIKIIGRISLKSIALTISILFLLMGITHSEVYKWVDDKGTVHFTEDPTAIPEKYRQNTEHRSIEEIEKIPQKSKELKPTLQDYSGISSKPLLLEFTIARDNSGSKYIFGYMMNNTPTLMRNATMDINCYDEGGLRVDSAYVSLWDLEPGIVSEFKRMIDIRTTNLKVIRLKYY